MNSTNKKAAAVAAMKELVAAAADAPADTVHDKRAMKADDKSKTLRDFGKTSLAFVPVILRSNLFGHGSGTRAIFENYSDVAVYGNTRIEFKGEELRQDDLRVLLALLRRRSGKVVGDAITITARTFCREDLGWSDGGPSADKLKAAVLRLADARARIHYEKGMTAMSFISDVTIPEEGDWTIWLSDVLAPILNESFTYLNASERLSMKDGLGSWLYGFIKSQWGFVKSDCGMIEFDREKLRVASGSGYVVKAFNRAVVDCLETFKEKGIIADFAVRKGILAVRPK